MSESYNEDDVQAYAQCIYDGNNQNAPHAAEILLRGKQSPTAEICAAMANDPEINERVTLSLLQQVRDAFATTLENTRAQRIDLSFNFSGPMSEKVRGALIELQRFLAPLNIRFIAEVVEAPHQVWDAVSVANYLKGIFPAMVAIDDAGAPGGSFESLESIESFLNSGAVLEVKFDKTLLEHSRRDELERFVLLVKKYPFVYVVFEGIENDDQLQYVQSIINHCGFPLALTRLQGYLQHTPSPLTQALQMLAI